jgi:hypothetical protein
MVPRGEAWGVTVQNVEIEEIFFRPPLAIARLGGSDTPLECFVWARDPTIHGGHRTVIRPAPSLEVLSDGTLRPYWPGSIQFRDGNLLRPVAPFFELWANLSGEKEPQPLTLRLLQGYDPDASLDSIDYTITVANRKAQRRTGSAACAYIANTSAKGSDHARKRLSAYSPHTSGEEPLVFKDDPIPLGHFQVIRPLNRVALGINLATLRVRFTPAEGQVYGPPTAISGPASPLPPGVALSQRTLGGRLHEIVPERNRILNSKTPWSSWKPNPNDSDPQPADSYDGANVGEMPSWGVVDDTCDGIIEARVVLKNRRHTAHARVFSSCPDFAPDRRPFYSIADDLADRDGAPIDVNKQWEETEATIADLFERAFETASLFNLDAMRERAIVENAISSPQPPRTDERSMTSGDRPYAFLTAAFPEKSAPGFSLPYAATAQYAHARLSDIETLLDFFIEDPRRVESLVRRPFGRFQDLKRAPVRSKDFRDPRIQRDCLHDMQMPPYLRDSDLNPLSITYRQYRTLMDFLDWLPKRPRIAGRHDSPIARRTVEALERHRQKLKEIKKIEEEPIASKEGSNNETTSSSRGRKMKTAKRKK